MNRREKLTFIFETGKRLRFFMDDQVMCRKGSDNRLCDELSNIQMRAAMSVRYHQPMSLNELAEKLNVTAPSASVMVDRLVKKEVLARFPDPQDRRRVQLSIHPNSEACMEDIHQRFHAAFEKIGRRVGDENVERWYTVMQQVREALKAEERGESPNEI